MGSPEFDFFGKSVPLYENIYINHVATAHTFAKLYPVIIMLLKYFIFMF